MSNNKLDFNEVSQSLLVTTVLVTSSRIEPRQILEKLEDKISYTNRNKIVLSPVIAGMIKFFYSRYYPQELSIEEFYKLAACLEHLRVSDKKSLLDIVETTDLKEIPVIDYMEGFLRGEIDAFSAATKNIEKSFTEIMFLLMRYDISNIGSKLIFQIKRIENRLYPTPQRSRFLSLIKSKEFCSCISFIAMYTELSAFREGGHVDDITEDEAAVDTIVDFLKSISEYSEVNRELLYIDNKSSDNKEDVVALEEELRKLELEYKSILHKKIEQERLTSTSNKLPRLKTETREPIAQESFCVEEVSVTYEEKVSYINTKKILLLVADNSTIKEVPDGVIIERIRTVAEKVLLGGWDYIVFNVHSIFHKQTQRVTAMAPNENYFSINVLNNKRIVEELYSKIKLREEG